MDYLDDSQKIIENTTEKVVAEAKEQMKKRHETEKKLTIAKKEMGEMWGEIEAQQRSSASHVQNMMAQERARSEIWGQRKANQSAEPRFDFNMV